MTTRDGRRMWLRPMRSDDAIALQRAYARMDPRDQRARLFAPIPELTNEVAQRFCRTDEAREICLVLEADDEPGEVLGGGRLMGEPSGKTAEFAVSLRSDLKGKGLGRVLLTTLLALAPQMGFKIVWGLMLADNTAMRTLAEKLGFASAATPTIQAWSGQCLRFPSDEREQPATPLVRLPDFPRCGA